MKPHKAEIQTGILISERLRFHTDSVVDKQYTSDYYSKYLAYIESFIEDEVKKERFRTFLNNPPFPTVELVERIWRKRDRIFNAADPYQRLEFSNPENRELAEEFLEQIQFDESFKNEINEYRKTSPNSFWVVTVEKDKNGKPNPYFCIQDISVVIDYYDTTKGLDYVIYKDKTESEDYPHGKLVAIDSEKYTLIPYNKNGDILYDEVLEVKHGLTITPAGQLSRQPLLKQDYQVKTNIIVNQLAALDTYLFAKVSKKYLDSYMFPIIEKIEEECDYRDADGTECEGGYLNYESWVIDETYTEGGYYSKHQKECPTCKAHRIIGAGTVITKPAPDSETPLVGDAVKFVTPPVDYLDYTKMTMKEVEDAILKNTVGQVNGTTQAQNEMQVEAQFEDRKDVLLDESKEMAHIKKAIIDTLMSFKYNGQFLESYVSLGKEFYLYTIADLEERKKLAIENGASQTELMQLQEKIINTEYNGNPTLRDRLIMLLHLEPFPLLDIEKANNLLQIGVISKFDFEKKIKFDKLVRKFEREQGNIIEFMYEAPIDRRIELIDNILNDYLDEENRQNEKRNDVRELGQPTGVPVSNGGQREVRSAPFENGNS